MKLPENKQDRIRHLQYYLGDVDLCHRLITQAKRDIERAQETIDLYTYILAEGEKELTKLRGEQSKDEQLAQILMNPTPEQKAYLEKFMKGTNNG